MSAKIIPELIIGASVVVSVIAAKLSADSFFRMHERHPSIRPAKTADRQVHKVGVVINPSKNKFEEARAFIIEACQEAKWPQPQFWETTVEDPGTAQTKAALRAGCDLILACGGDGTVRKCAQQLLHTDVPLGIVPIGTGNLFSRNLKLEVTKQREAVRTALFGKERYVDVGHITLDQKDKEVWLVMSGMGADATAIAKTRPTLKKYFSWLAYVEAGMRAVQGRRDRVKVIVDDQEPFETSIRSIIGANCSIMPGGVDLIPEALIDDGQMDVIMISPRTPIGWLSIGTRVLFQAKHQESIFKHIQAQCLQVTSEKPIEAEIDGDYVGMIHHMKLEIDAAALKVRVIS